MRLPHCEQTGRRDHSSLSLAIIFVRLPDDQGDLRSALSLLGSGQVKRSERSSASRSCGSCVRRQAAPARSKTHTMSNRSSGHSGIDCVPETRMRAIGGIRMCSHEISTMSSAAAALPTSFWSSSLPQETSILVGRRSAARSSRVAACCRRQSPGRQKQQKDASAVRAAPVVVHFRKGQRIGLTRRPAASRAL